MGKISLAAFLALLASTSSAITTGTVVQISAACNDAATYSKDGTKVGIIATNAATNNLLAYDITTSNPLLWSQTEGSLGVQSIAVDAVHNRIAIGTKESTATVRSYIKIFNFTLTAPIATTSISLCCQYDIYSLDFDETGNKLRVGTLIGFPAGADNVVDFDLTDMNNIQQSSFHVSNQPVYTIAQSGGFIACGTTHVGSQAYNDLQVWSSDHVLRGSRMVGTSTTGVLCLAYNEDGTRLYAGTFNGQGGYSLTILGPTSDGTSTTLNLLGGLALSARVNTIIPIPGSNDVLLGVGDRSSGGLKCALLTDATDPANVVTLDTISPDNLAVQRIAYNGEILIVASGGDISSGGSLEGFINSDEGPSLQSSSVSNITFYPLKIAVTAAVHDWVLYQ